MLKLPVTAFRRTCCIVQWLGPYDGMLSPEPLPGIAKSIRKLRVPRLPAFRNLELDLLLRRSSFKTGASGVGSGGEGGGGGGGGGGKGFGALNLGFDPHIV